MPVIFSQCMDCKSYIDKNNAGQFYCKAFPDGIPHDVFGNKIEHTKPIPGDNGISFEPIDE